MGRDPVWNSVGPLGMLNFLKLELDRMMIKKKSVQFGPLGLIRSMVPDFWNAQPHASNLFVNDVSLVHVRVDPVNARTTPVLATIVRELRLEDFIEPFVSEQIMEEFNLVLGIRRRDQVTVNTSQSVIRILNKVEISQNESAAVLDGKHGLADGHIHSSPVLRLGLAIHVVDVSVALGTKTSEKDAMSRNNVNHMDLLKLSNELMLHNDANTTRVSCAM